MNSLERWYRWATEPRVHWGMWGTRFMLPAIPLLVLGFALMARDVRFPGAVVVGAATLWAATFVALGLRDTLSALAALWRKTFG